MVDVRSQRRVRRLAATAVVVVAVGACSSGGRHAAPSSTTSGLPGLGTSGSVVAKLRTESTTGVAVRTERGFVRSIFGRFPAAPPDQFLRDHAALFGLGAGGLELGPSSARTTAAGTITRYGLVVNGVLVLGALVAVERDETGDVLFVLATGPTRVDLTANTTVDEVAAITVARVEARAASVPLTRRLIADLDGDGTASDQVWEVRFSDHGQPDRIVLVDATTAAVRAVFDDEAESECPTRAGAIRRRAIPESSPADDLVVIAGRRVADQVLEYFHDRFGRNGYDGKGGVFTIVHGPRSAWQGNERMSLATSEAVLDVVAHELTHSVVGSDAFLNLGPTGRAINESYADVFASFIDGNWTIGEQTPKLRRDLSIRRTSVDYQTLPIGVDPSDGNDSGCSHSNSTILSHAAWLAVNGCPASDAGPDGYCRLVKSRIGVRQAEQVYYESIARLGSGHDFAAVRDEIVRACDRLLVSRKYGVRPQDCAALIDAFHSIGYGPPDTDSDGVVDEADNCSDVFNPDQAPNKDDLAIGEACIRTAPVKEPPPPPSTAPPPAEAGLEVIVVENKTKEATEGVCSRGPDETVPTVLHHSLAYYIGDVPTVSRIAKQEVRPIDGKWFVYACRGSLPLMSRSRVLATGLTSDAALALVAKLAHLDRVTSGFTSVAGPEDGVTGSVTAAQIYAGG